MFESVERLDTKSSRYSPTWRKKPAASVAIGRPRNVEKREDPMPFLGHDDAPLCATFEAWVLLPRRVSVLLFGATPPSTGRADAAGVEEGWVPRRPRDKGCEGDRLVNRKDYAGEITSAEAWKMLSEEPRAVLIDVRTEGEWVYVGIPNLSSLGKQPLFIEWQRFPRMQQNPEFVSQLDACGLERDAPLLIICRSGIRSRFAAIALTAVGYGPCYNVSDGFEGDLDDTMHRGELSGWKAADLPWEQT